MQNLPTYSKFIYKLTFWRASIALRPGVTDDRASTAGGVSEFSRAVALSSPSTLAGGVSLGDTSIAGMSGVLELLQISPFGIIPFTGVTVP